MGTLSVVATPIGNLKDITLRALETLKNADVIFCEDTRVTGKLLSVYEIKKPLVRADANKEREVGERAVRLLEEGKHIALVTDAGTPGISDPGARIVSCAREVGARIEVIPGPSSLSSALSLLGEATHEFIFLGFLPHKKGRATLFKKIEESRETVLFFESPHRLMKTLETLKEVLEESRLVYVFRELTKLHESVVRGSSNEVLNYFHTHADQIRGEIVIAVLP